MRPTFFLLLPVADKRKKMKDVFIEGPIDPERITDAIAAHQKKKNIGAHHIFLGQVRADEMKDSRVKAIEYSAQKEIANKVIHEIREEAFERFELACLHIYHSLGIVDAGAICFFVFVSSAHRHQSREALAFLVDAVKARAPIFGKELLEDGGHQWKRNK